MTSEEVLEAEIERLRTALLEIANLDIAKDSPNSVGWRAVLAWAVQKAQITLYPNGQDT